MHKYTKLFVYLNAQYAERPAFPASHCASAKSFFSSSEVLQMHENTVMEKWNWKGFSGAPYNIAGNQRSNDREGLLCLHLDCVSEQSVLLFRCQTLFFFFSFPANQSRVILSSCVRHSLFSPNFCQQQQMRQEENLISFLVSLIATSYLTSKLLRQPVSCLYNGVTRCLYAAASHCVCGPEAAKRPYHLHLSIFIVDIYFCNYFSTSPSAKDDMPKLTLPLPSVSLLLLSNVNTPTEGPTDRCRQTYKMKTFWWVLSSTMSCKWSNQTNPQRTVSSIPAM